MRWIYEKLLPPQAALVVTSPTLTDAGTYEFDRSVDLETTWVPAAGSPKVIAPFMMTGGDERLIEIGCLFDGAAGKGTIPAAALAKLQDGIVQLDVTPATILDFDESGWQLRLIARGIGPEIAGPTK